MSNESHPESAIALLKRWATPVPEIGPAVYRITQAPGDHKHAYHIFCPWSPDDRQLLLLRYNRTDPEAEIGVMDAATGEINAVGKTTAWESHTAARQRWVGRTGRLFYPAGKGMSPGQSETTYVTCNADGTDAKTISTPPLMAVYLSSDGRYLFGSTPFDMLFPDDTIADPADKGLWRIDLETGGKTLLLSVEQAVQLLPASEAAAPCHLYMKMIIVHPRRERILFNLTNTFWDRDGMEPRIRSVISVGTDGADPAYVGEIAHHPNWHTTENLVIANSRDCNDKIRLVLFPGDGQGLVDYVPRTKGSGHPTLSPDGKVICTDGGGPRGTEVIFCHPREGRSVVAFESEECGGGYVSFQSVDERADGETVTQALKRSTTKPQTWQTQRHPAWSRDGSAVLVNSDQGTGSQLYAIDVAATLDAGGLKLE